MILLDAPQLGQAGGIDDLEDTRVAAFPGNQIAVLLIPIVQQLLQKVPKETAIYESKVSISWFIDKWKFNSN